MNPAQLNQETTAAQAAGKANQAALNAQSTQLQGQYGAAVTGANTTQNAANTANAGIQNGGTLYGQDLTNQEQSVGFNPASLTQANKNLTAVQNQVAYAPTAAQQSGNYYGTTAGGTTNIYSGLMANLNPGLTNATNAAGNLTNEYGQLTGAANQQAGLTVTSENNAATQANATYQNAVQQMNVAGTTMAAIEALVQSQGTATATQVSDYQNAYSSYITAQAAATQASVASRIAPSTIAQQTAMAKYYSSNPTPTTTTPKKTTTSTTKVAPPPTKSAVPTASGNSVLDYATLHNGSL